jgi:hypothetical protein
MLFEYFFHGIHFSSEINLEVNQTVLSDSPLLSCRIREIDPPEEFAHPAIWESELKLDNDMPQAKIYRVQDVLWMELPRVGGFCFHREGVDVYRTGPVSLSSYFLGRALSLWLELRGIPVLHGSCLLSEARTIGLLGYTGAGKSTLGAYLASRDFRLVAEDVLPLHGDRKNTVYRGVAQIRLWEDSGKFIFSEFNRFPQIHSYTQKRKINFDDSSSYVFQGEKADLSEIYVLERNKDPDTRPELITMPPGQALIELVRQSFGTGPTHALGLQKNRMADLAVLVEHIPVYRLLYPSGHERLAEVYNLICKGSGPL